MSAINKILKIISVLEILHEDAANIKCKTQEPEDFY